MSTEREVAVSTKTYPSGRCRAIALAERRRCRNPCARGRREGLCATHAAETDPVTIDSDPRTLIEAVSEQFPARCRAIEWGGPRCETGCGPTDRLCSFHQTASVCEVTDALDDGELDTALIKQALSSVTESRAMTDGGHVRTSDADLAAHEHANELEAALDYLLEATRRAHGDVEAEQTARLKLATCGVRLAFYTTRDAEREIGLTDATEHLETVVEAVADETVAEPVRRALQLFENYEAGGSGC